MNRINRLRMPAEWYPHHCCWMLWPSRPDNWPNNAANACKAFTDVITAISRFETVKVGYLMKDFDIINAHLGHLTNVDMYAMEYDDCWMRDVGPTFTIDNTNGNMNDDFNNNLGGINWKFNAWGEIYKPYDNDNAVAKSVLTIANIPADNQTHLPDFVLEGGSIHVDGEGTILTTEECLLNSNRNPHLSKAQIEQFLLQHLNAQKVIWLPYGIVADIDTNGHIDNFCCFSKPAEVLLSWTEDDINDSEQCRRCMLAYEVLRSSTDAKNRPFNIVKVPLPPPMHYTEADCSGLKPLASMTNDSINSTTADNTTGSVDTCSDERRPGQRMAASYINFYIANNAIIMPAFNVATDDIARTVLQTVFPRYEIVAIASARDILVGGGNIHCITQQQPMLV